MVTTTAADSVRLTERDRQILCEHFGRFRISTIEALKQVYWEGCTADAAKKWWQRMHAGEYLRYGDLGNGRMYIYPAHKTVTLSGLPRRITRPPTGWDLARLYGVLSFCCLGPFRHEKIASPDFHKRFERLCHKSLDQSLYYADTDYQDSRYPRRNRIGYLLVDAGALVRQVMARFNHVVSLRLVQKDTLWPQWIEQGRFIVTVVTADPDKQRRLHEALAASHPPVPFRVEVRLDLRDVIPLRIAHASQRQDNP